MALQRPRNLMDVRTKLMLACRRPNFAEDARYSLPRGKKSIEGYSIRFAEEVARCLTNLLIERRVIFEDDERRMILVSVTDLENNLTYPAEFIISKTVERSTVRDGQEVVGQRTNTSGQATYIVRATEEEMLGKESSWASRAIRQNVLRLTPGDLLDEALTVLETTVKDRDAKDPEGTAKRLATNFASVGVTAAQLEKYLKKPLNAVNEHELGRLRGICTAIREAETSWAAVTGEVAAAEVNEGDAKLKDELKQALDKNRGATK